VLHALFAPDHARQVLAGTRGHTKQLSLYREIAAALGDGLLTSDGDDWQRQRRFVQPLFTRQRIARLRHGDGRGGHPPAAGRRRRRRHRRGRQRLPGHQPPRPPPGPGTAAGDLPTGEFRFAFTLFL
jgi:hypothetical protein